MTEYNVKFAKSAKKDLGEIYSYISGTLKETRTALRIYASIKREIESLSIMPERCPVINAPPYTMAEVRKLSAENYLVFYQIDKEKDIVWILRIIHSRREWQHILTTEI